MWKAVIADDERIIVKGLKKLINWEELDVEIVGEAYDGQQLKKAIEYAEPDLVISDIKMPYLTGLEVISWCNEQFPGTKFIFCSGFQEFSYAKEAIRQGAVDYLLKPVGRKDLEEAVRKATQQLEEQNTIEIFREEKNELQELFKQINEGRDFENNELYEMFQKDELDMEDSFFVGIAAGVCPDIAESMSRENYGRYNLLRFSVFNQVGGAFGSRKLGFVVQKDEHCIYVVGVFPNRDKADYLEKYVEPIRREVEENCQMGLCFGVGTPTEDISGILESYKSAKFAFGLYFFEERGLLPMDEIHREYRVSFDDYKEDAETAFRYIIGHDERAMEAIDRVMDDIEAIHYGNWKAVRMRTMNFTGDMNVRLHQYQLLGKDFYEIQDGLQQQVASCMTFSALKQTIHGFYENLNTQVQQTDRSKDKVLIEDVKKYIQEHYAENLSIRELADVACVSQNYFSAMFKKETGENYKTYLTGIRMEKAVELLRTTDLKTYEIGEQIGYNNVRRFVDAFKQIYQMSPMDYKKKLKS